MATTSGFNMTASAIALFTTPIYLLNTVLRQQFFLYMSLFFSSLEAIISEANTSQRRDTADETSPLFLQSNTIATWQLHVIEAMDPHRCPARNRYSLTRRRPRSKRSAQNTRIQTTRTVNCVNLIG